MANLFSPMAKSVSFIQAPKYVSQDRGKTTPTLSQRGCQNTSCTATHTLTRDVLVRVVMSHALPGADVFTVRAGIIGGNQIGEFFFSFVRGRFVVRWLFWILC